MASVDGAGLAGGVDALGKEGKADALGDVVSGGACGSGVAATGGGEDATVWTTQSGFCFFRRITTSMDPEDSCEWIRFTP